MRFSHSTDGNVAILFAVGALAIAAGVGAAVDLTRASGSRGMLQAAVDAAALEGAVALREDASSFQDRAAAVFSANIQGAGWTQRPSVAVSQAADRVTATASGTVQTLLGALVGLEMINISATAAATLEAGPPLCGLSLNGAAEKAIEFTGQSAFTAENCLIYANSDAPNAIHVTAQASASASGFCAVGGANGAESRLSPAASGSCTPIVDPDYPIPSWKKKAPCSVLKKVEVGDYQVLTPGRYCEGLVIEGRARLTPGIYIFDGKPLLVTGNGELEGDDVVLRFNGSGSYFKFTNDTRIRLTAPKTGPYAGLVLAGDKQSIASSNGLAFAATSTIDDASVVNITGAIYLPNHLVIVNGEAQVGVGTDYIAFIVDTLKIDGDARVDLAARPLAAGYPDRLPRAFFMPRLLR